MRDRISIYQGIQWAGTAEADVGYRTSYTNPATGITTQGFNLEQWFNDQGITGDHSYYRYAQIRNLGAAGFQAGAGGGQLDAGNAFGQRTLQNLYTYSGTSPADMMAVPPQTITPISTLGIDTWGRPLPAGYKTPEEMAARRLAGATGGQTSTIGGGGAAPTGAPSSDPLALSKIDTLGKK